MKKKEIKIRMNQLISLLERWRHYRYYLFQEVVPLEIYDQHFQELEDLEKKSKIILHNSPTQNIGVDPNSNDFSLVSREIPMLSLDSVNNFEDLVKWEKSLINFFSLNEEKKIEYVCEWKIDGLSASVIFSEGKLISISSRGNGYVGEDLTENKKLIRNIPLFLNSSDSFEVRGEIFIKKEDFNILNERLKKEKKKLLSNTRNVAAGAMQRLNYSSEKNLSFFAYNVIGKEKILNQKQCLEFLFNNNFSIPSFKLCLGIKEVWDFIENASLLRKDLEFDSDGIVIKINDWDLQEKIGRTKRFPRWSIAYKFPSSLVYKKILSIDSRVNKNGRISYVAFFSPFVLLGSKIQKVTLHNYKFISEKKINIGDELIITKAGSVVPQAVGVVKLTDNIWKAPVLCPSCFSVLHWDNNHLFQMCLNDDCVQKKIKKLSFFVSKDGLKIDSLGEKIVEKLFFSGLIKKFSDFFNLSEKKEELTKIEGIKEKMASKIIFEIEKSKKYPLEILISSLSIPGISREKSKQIAKFYSSFSLFIKALNEEKWQEIEKLLGKSAKNEISVFWSDNNKKKEILDLEKILIEK